MNWYMTALQKYAVFEGRAGLAEYWMFVLFNFLIALAMVLLDALIVPGDIQLLTGLYGLFMIIPSLAVAVRRLHDTNRSGWWMLITLVPIVGSLILLFFLISKGDEMTNDFGPSRDSIGAM